MNRQTLPTATPPAHPSCGLLFFAATPNKAAASLQRMVSVHKVTPHLAEDRRTKSFASLNTLKFPALHAVLEESELSCSRPWLTAWKAGGRGGGVERKPWACSSRDGQARARICTQSPGLPSPGQGAAAAETFSQAKGKRVPFLRGGGGRASRVPASSVAVTFCSGDAANVPNSFMPRQSAGLAVGHSKRSQESHTSISPNASAASLSSALQDLPSKPTPGASLLPAEQPWHGE